MQSLVRGLLTPRTGHPTRTWDHPANEAITALKGAFEIDPRCVEWAKNDVDLDAIRGVPGSPV